MLRAVAWPRRCSAWLHGWERNVPTATALATWNPCSGAVLGPDEPSAPLGPFMTAPAAPVAPVAPCAPTGPAGPCGPAGPTSPSVFTAMGCAVLCRAAAPRRVSEGNDGRDLDLAHAGLGTGRPVGSSRPIPGRRPHRRVQKMP